MPANVRPDPARPRLVASALLGALIVVVGWGVWSIMSKTEPPVPAPPPGAAVADAVLLEPPRAAPAPRPIERAASADVRGVRVAAGPTTPALRDGLVLDHGMPTAIHALAADAGAEVPSLAPTAAVLPPGVQPEDASVNRAGIVTLKRSANTPAGGEAATADAPRTATLTRSP